MVVEEAPVDPQAEAATPTSITANSAPIILRPSRTTTTNAYLRAPRRHLPGARSNTGMAAPATDKQCRGRGPGFGSGGQWSWTGRAESGTVLVPSRRVGAMSSTRLVARDDPDRHPLPGGGSLRSR